MLLLALSTGHKVGLAVTGAAFIGFALASAFLFTRIRPNFPGRGLPAFIVVAIVFFIGMLTAVEVFGAEPKEKKAAGEQSSTSQSQPATTATAPQPSTTTTAAATTSTARTTTAQTTTAAGPATTVQVTETEFKITLSPSGLKAGKVTFQVKNSGKIPHDLAIAGGPKTSLISPGGSGTLTATLKAGPLELYCSVPGHKQAGMDLKLTVS